MKLTDHSLNPWFSHLTPSEQASLQEWEMCMRQRREDAGVYARWIKQASDRAKKRMAKSQSQKETTNV